MPFTVAREGGMPGMESEWYARLLHYKGFDLADLSRTPDPGTPGRWLAIWEMEPEAEAFANELRERSGDAAWHVVSVEGPVSRGPLGPIEIQFGRQADGISFSLHPLSLKMIQNRFPTACGIDNVSLRIIRNPDRSPVGAELQPLARQALTLLTSLSPEELAVFGGFRLINTRKRCEVLPPQPLPGGLPDSSPVAVSNGGSLSQTLR
jgi:hypothetical protein